MEIYFSLPPLSVAEAMGFLRAISQARADAAHTRHPAARGLIEVRVQWSSAASRVYLSAAALRLAVQYDICSSPEKQHAARELPSDAQVMLKYEPSFTTRPGTMRVVEHERARPSQSHG